MVNQASKQAGKNISSSRQAADKAKTDIVIIIRDGRVISFEQKVDVLTVEGMYGDGI